MPKRRKKAAVPVGTTLKIVPVEPQAFASANVKFSSARAYDPEMLALAYPDGDMSKAVVMRLASRPETAPADTEMSYFAYACGFLDGFEDLLLLRDDPSGEVLSRLLSGGAALLFDEERVPDTASPDRNVRFPDVLPAIGAAGFVYEMLWHSLSLGRNQALRKLSYIGNLPKNTGYALAYAAVAEELNANMRKFMREAFALASLSQPERNAIRAHTPQIVIPASFGHFNEFEEAAVDRIARVSPEDIALAKEFSGVFAEGALAKEPSYASAYARLSKISGTFKIWTRMLDDVKRDGKTDEIREEARKLRCGDAEFEAFAQRVFSKVPSLARGAFAEIAAVGMAAGVDLVLEAYYAGATIESLIPGMGEDDTR